MLVKSTTEVTMLATTIFTTIILPRPRPHHSRSALPAGNANQNIRQIFLRSIKKMRVAAEGGSV